MNDWMLMLLVFLAGVVVGRLPRHHRKRKGIKFNKPTLYENQNGICAGCKGLYQKKDMAVDHIQSHRHGGSDHIDNLQLLCHHCNSIKGDRPMRYLMGRLDNTKKRKSNGTNPR